MSAQIAPWSMPNEPIPIRINWSKNLEVVKVMVRLPLNLIPEEFLNFEKVTSTEGLIKGIPKYPSPTDPNYVGIVIKHPAIPKSLQTSYEIFISVYTSDEISKDVMLTCNIFRPSIEVTKEPPEIILNDEGKESKIPISLKYIGFGEIKLKLEAQIKGKIVTKSGSVTRDFE